MKLIIRKTTKLLYLLAIMAMILVLVLYYIKTININYSSSLVEHTQEVLRRSDDVLLNVVTIDASARGFFLTGNEKLLEPYYLASKNVSTNLNLLGLITKDNPQQQLRIDSLRKTVDERLSLVDQMITVRRKNDLIETVRIVEADNAKVATNKIRNLITDIYIEEFGLLKLRKSNNVEQNRNYEIIFGILLLLVIVVIVLALIISRNQKERNKEIETFTAAQKILSKYSLSLIEASLDPLVTISADGKITDVNEASVKITGVLRDQLIGTDFSNYFTEPLKAKEGYMAAFKNGFVADYALTVRHVEGKLTDVLYNASLYKDDDGNVLGVFAAARDVTTQKLLSKYSRSLIEASRDPLFTINTDGKITDINEASVNVTGVPRVKLLGTDFYSYFTDPERAKEAYEHVFNFEFVADFPLTIIDGELTDVLFNGSVYKDDRGNVLGAVLVARDITDQKRIEKEFVEAKVFAELATVIAEEAKDKAEKAKQIAENAVNAKQQFLSNMSHEIRTPMNAIIGFTKVLLKTDLNPKQREYLIAIKMSGDALIVLINDILDLAKVDAGKMTFEEIPFKLESSVLAILHLFEPKIEEKNIALIKEFDPGIPKVLLGDPVRLHQIIINLLSNAVKFTAKGKITISIKLIREEENYVSIEFTFTDTGIGIAESKMFKIFENFQQASSGTSRLYGGTGLGLSIVKHLVESQGGSIHVESKDGIGSSFSFVLGFKKTSEEAIMDKEIIELSTDKKNIQVLVVEDIALNQLLMKTLLDDFGFERDIAGNGKIAIEKLQAKHYDIILMDLQMPEMNGFEATEYIRNVMHSSIPIIALTADVTTMDLSKCKEVGMNDYLAKPVDERLLFSKIINLVKLATPLQLIEDSIPGTIISDSVKCTNLDYLLHRTKSDPLLMIEMITLFLDQTPNLVKVMKQSLENKDWKLLYGAVHKMVPSFSIMGINKDFEKIAVKIQEYAVRQQMTEEMPEMVAELENVLKRACIELQHDLTEIQNNNQ